jgi:tetratricopeptide (TPR) repeat protein
MPSSVSFNLINLGGLKVGSHVSFSYSPARGSTQDENLKEAAELPLPFHDLTESPSTISFLSWHTRLSDFCGRKHEIGQLTSWALQQGTISTKVIIGEGGGGKSRLAAEFCRRMRAAGWSAGFVDLTRISTFRVNEIGGLLVIDYPEESRSEIASLLETLARSEYPSKLRLILLTRRRMAYWSDYFARIRCEDIIDKNPIVLGRIKSSDLFTVYQSTLDRAAERFETVPLPLSEQAFGQWVSLSPENSFPLFVMAAALHAAIYPNDPIVHYAGRDVVSALVRREMQRLGPISEAIGLGPQVVARVLSFATLAGGLAASEVQQLPNIQGLGFEEIDDPAQPLAAAGLLSDGTIDVPKPDLLAAAMTAACLKDCSKDAPGWVWLAMTLHNRLDAACNRLARIVHDEHMVFGASASVISSLLINSITGNLLRLRRLSGFFVEPNSPHSLAHLDEFIWWETAKLETLPSLKAASLNNLAVCLIYRRAYREAAAALEQADEIHAANPGLFGFRDEFERGLRQLNLGKAYYGVKDYRNAIPVLRSSVRYLRSARRAGIDQGGVELPSALDHLGRSLLRNGQKGGLQLEMEAVRIARGLAKTCPDSHEHILATALINLGVVRREMGNRPGALAAFTEAEKVARRLVQSHSGRHEQTLAIALTNSANVLSESGDVEGSVKLAEEAALLFRALNATADGVYVAEEVTNIGQLSEIYAKAGDWTRAADAAADYFRRREKHLEAVGDNSALDTEVAQYLAIACLEMHGVVEGFRYFETALREFSRAVQQIGPLDAIFEHARYTKNGS